VNASIHGGPGILMTEVAIGFVCAALIALYTRSTGRDHIERWTLGLVTWASRLRCAARTACRP
jgi:hypothetical protein